MQQQHVTHVLFDMDGLLLDTERFYSAAQQAVLDRVKPGTQFTWELKARQMGMKALASTQFLVDELQLGGLITAEEFLAQREEQLAALFPTAQLMPGAEKLVRHLAACGVPIAVATSSHRAHFDVKTQAHQPFFALFDAVVTGDMVAKGKPDPEIFQRAAATFAQPPAAPANVLVFEDAPSGVQAALAAGMACVMVPDANLDAGLVAKLGATDVLGSLCEFVPERWGLPPFGASEAAAAQQLLN